MVKENQGGLPGNVCGNGRLRRYKPLLFNTAQNFSAVNCKLVVLLVGWQEEHPAC